MALSNRALGFYCWQCKAGCGRYLVSAVALSLRLGSEQRHKPGQIMGCFVSRRCGPRELIRGKVIPCPPCFQLLCCAAAPQSASPGFCSRFIYFHPSDKSSVYVSYFLCSFSPLLTGQGSPFPPGVPVQHIERLWNDRCISKNCSLDPLDPSRVAAPPSPCGR